MTYDKNDNHLMFAGGRLDNVTGGDRQYQNLPE